MERADCLERGWGEGCIIAMNNGEEVGVLLPDSGASMDIRTRQTPHGRGRADPHLRTGTIPDFHDDLHAKEREEELWKKCP